MSALVMVSSVCVILCLTGVPVRMEKGRICNCWIQYALSRLFHDWVQRMEDEDFDRPMMNHGVHQMQMAPLLPLAGNFLCFMMAVTCVITGVQKIFFNSVHPSYTAQNGPKY